MPRRTAPLSRWLLLALGVAVPACSANTSDDAANSDDAITSNDGTPLEFRFSGEVIARSNDTARKAIASQLQYVQGILTTKHQANGQTGMPSLSNIREISEGTTKRITYDVALPVIWPKSETKPTTYDFVLPHDATKLDDFNAKYDGACGRNEYGQETFWHDWNPNAPGCKPDAADIHESKASVAPHPQTTQGKYPEYDKIWEDDALDVVAVFGIISSNTPDDEGARTREKLLGDAKASLDHAERTEAPARAGVLHDSTVSGTVSIDGKDRRVRVTGILVQEVSSAGSAFNERFTSVTENADVVVYEGHSGLGANIDTLARNMGAKRDKYQLVYLYGCQTLAYLEPTMHEKRIALNGASRDPEGTKYLDIIANALPAYGDEGRSTLGLYRAMLAPSAPKTFNQLIAGISPWHLVAVFGEHDNAFEP